MKFTFHLFIGFVLAVNPLLAGPLYKPPPLDIDFTDPSVRMIAGIRPYRRGGIRMDREVLGDVVVWHNYGHGGAGLTLSWGTVEEVLFQAEADLRRAKKIVVLGAGVIGLTTAFELNRLGYVYEHYSAKKSPSITSNVAGGLWSPSSVDLKSHPDEEQVFRILRRSYLRYQSLLNSQFSVREMPFFKITDPKKPSKKKYSLETLAKMGVLPPMKLHKQLPIQGFTRGGKEFTTFLIDTPKYIKQLTESAEKNTPISLRKFDSKEEIQQIVGSGAVVFNCTGLGSYHLFDDKNLVPVRGQLVLVSRGTNFPESSEDFMIGGDGYYFPRSDELVLGGTYEFGEWDPTPEPKVGREILNRHKNNFGFEIFPTIRWEFP